MARSVEICMITTVDGTIDVNGRSGSLGGPADQQRLALLRRQASVILVGAGTAKAENYGPPSRTDLRIGVVTKSCNLDFTSALFAGGSGFVVTTLDAPVVPVDSIRAGNTEIDFARIIEQLPEGIIHVEGGPMLNAALCDADVVDALNLTIAPHLVGSRGDGLTVAPHAPQHFELATTELVDGFVFLRYERRKKSTTV
jgi:riboflavin biosynthesis pyrimidine reductase